jgi:hypothetical protein
VVVVVVVSVVVVSSTVVVLGPTAVVGATVVEGWVVRVTTVVVTVVRGAAVVGGTVVEVAVVEVAVVEVVVVAGVAVPTSVLCGDPPEEATVNVPVWSPTVPGVNTTWTVQLPPWGTTTAGPQLPPVTANGPLTLTERRVTEAGLEKVATCAVAVSPTTTVPKLRVDGERVAAVPWPRAGSAPRTATSAATAPATAMSARLPAISPPPRYAPRAGTGRGDPNRYTG